MRTNNDLAHLAHIKTFYTRHHRLPTYQELHTLTKLSSRASLFQLIQRLIDKKLLSKDMKGRLAPLPSFFERTPLGVVEAGFGFDGSEIPNTSYAIDAYLIEKPESTFLVTVKGESMKDAGILPGDTVIVERTHEAKNGAIVIAEVDGAWTMKYYRNERGKHVLIPANAHMQPYTPKESFRISGIVRGIIRKYM